MAEVIHYLTFAGVPLSGVLQVETAVIAGTVTTAGMTGSPKAVVVALALNDTAAQAAGRMRTALEADTDVNAFFTVGGSGANVVLTARVTAADDATMNIAYADTTSDGLTDDATSNATTAGVYGTYRGVPQGVYCADTTNGKMYVNAGSQAIPTWRVL